MLLESEYRQQLQHWVSACSVPGGVMLSMIVLIVPLIAAQMMCIGFKQILQVNP